MHTSRLNPFVVIISALSVAALITLPSSLTFAQNPPIQPGAAAPPAGAPLAEAPQEPPTEAERIIDLAIKKLASLKSAAADMVQDVKMLKQSFQLKGRYLKAPGSRIYLKLSINGLPDSGATMLQVCDGETLWDYQQVLESQTYRKFSIKPIFERLNSPEIDPKLRDQIMSGLGFGGPETILVGLRKSIKFDQKEEDDYEGKPVYVLRGTWRSRNGLVGPDQKPVPPNGPLPAFVPSQATLYLGKEDGWPYKLIMVGKLPTILQDNRSTGVDGRLTSSKSSIEKVEPSRMDITYSDVKLNPRIKEEDFAFQAPPNVTPEDGTQSIIQGLDQSIQAMAMQKKVEAAKKEGPVLEQPLELPKNSGESPPR